MAKRPYQVVPALPPVATPMLNADGTTNHAWRVYYEDVQDQLVYQGQDVIFLNGTEVTVTADKFRIKGATTDIEPFSIDGDQIVMTGDVSINGSLIVDGEVTFSKLAPNAASLGQTLVEPVGTNTDLGVDAIADDQGPSTYPDNVVSFTIPNTNVGDSIHANVIIGFSDRSNLVAQLYQHSVSRANIRDWKTIVDAGGDASNRYVPLNGRIDGQAGSTTVIVVPDGGPLIGGGQRWKWVKLSYTHHRR